MQKIWQKIKAIPVIHKLNTYSFMPIIWWSLLTTVLPYCLSLLKVPVVWRVGLLFLIINNVISFHVGVLIKKRQLSYWWVLCLPIIFDLAILPHFANYNLIFGIIYLILEAFGLINNQIYR